VTARSALRRRLAARSLLRATDLFQGVIPLEMVEQHWRRTYRLSPTRSASALLAAEVGPSHSTRLGWTDRSADGTGLKAA